MIYPQFPSFKILELSDKEIIESFNKDYAPYSDYNFVSLYSWNTKGEIAYTFLNDNLVVKFSDYETGEPFYSFLGTSSVSKTVEILFELSQIEHLETRLKLIPEENLHEDYESVTTQFLVKEDIDNFDYIYDIEEKASLIGEKYFNRRKAINKFARNYPDHRVIHINLDDSSTISQIYELFDLWTQYRDGQDKEDRKAFERLLAVHKNFNLVTLGVEITGKLKAFFIAEPVHDLHVVAHFATSDLNYTGLDAFLSHEMCVYLSSQKYRFINYEQDLGLPGLRRAKEMWHPEHFLKKYLICKQ